MSTTDRLSSHFKAEFVAQVIAAGAGGLLTVILARLLAPTQYGLLFLAISVFGVLETFSKLGIPQSGARYIAEYKGTDETQVPHILRTSFLYTVATSSVIVAGLLVGHPFIADLLDEPDLGPFLVMGAAFIPLITLSMYVRHILQGFEEIKLAAAIEAINVSARLLFAVGLVVLGFGAFGALTGYILGFGIAAVLGLGLLFFRFYSPLENRDSIEAGLRRKIGEYALPLTATDAAGDLHERVDILLVGFFLNPTAVSYYYISKQIVKFVNMPARSLGFTLSPTFGAKKSENELEQAALLYRDSLVYLLLLYVPAAAGLILVAGPLIEQVFGAEYAGAVPVLQIIAVYSVALAITSLTSGGLDYMGKARVRAIIKGIVSVLNFALNLLLIPLMGVAGAALATVFTYSLYTAANVYLIHQEFDLDVQYLTRRVSLIVFITAIMSLVVFSIINLVDGIPSLVGGVIAGAVIWSALSFWTGLLDARKIAAVVT